ncbi:HalOD1 output domain-containing protein [Haladaptatus pallidirubidus]|uniref:Halobacterial output domain-containing protein n=1 Tax=Haladaptatus pallidirubidus TaxID=1008152 RepID=A0AAV3UG96_9EURY
MTKPYITDGGSDIDRSNRDYKFTYCIEDGQLPSIAVVRAVAAITNTPSTSLDPLHDVIDPDLLDRVFTETRDTVRARMSFAFNGCEVTVSRNEVSVVKDETEE